MNEPAMTVRQVAQYLNVAPKVVYRLVNEGTLPGFKVAGTWRFMREDINAWIEHQKQRPTTEVITSLSTASTTKLQPVVPVETNGQ